MMIHTQIVHCCDMPMGVTVILYTHSGTGLHMHKDCTYGIIGLLLVLFRFRWSSAVVSRSLA